MEKMNEYLDLKGAKLLVDNLLLTMEKKEHDKLYMVDEKGYEYVVKIQDGKFTSYCIHKYDRIEVSSLPNKTEYNAGSKFDPSGMVVLLVDTDGTTEEIKDYTYTRYIISDTINISYTRNNIEYNTSINVTVTPVNMEELLMDFEYDKNEDGTYTITAWKETFNGAPSTECIIPDNALINV